MMKISAYSSFLCAIGVLVLVSVIPETHAKLNYTCDYDGVITVDNPDPKMYIYAEANTSDTICTVTFNNSLQHIVLTGCNKSADITMILSDEFALPALFTKRLQFHAIKCETIPSAGITRSVVDDSFVTNIVSTSIAPTVTPAIDLSSGMQDTGTGESKPAAIIGEAVKWEIVAPEGYILVPLSCTAYSGNDVAASLYSIKLVNNGCSLDKNLLSHFQYQSPTEKHIVYAFLHAFKFADSNEVTIECIVKGCPMASTMCDFSCPDKRRRRSALSQVQRRSAIQPSDQSGYDVAARDNRQGKVKTSLRVIGDVDPAFMERYFGFVSYRVCSPSLLLAVTSAVVCRLLVAI